MRTRIKYGICGKIRFISHLDLMRAFFRACIRKNIPVEISKGFSPHLKLSFGPPLSVGITSSAEHLDMYLDRSIDLGLLKSDLQEVLPEGIKIEGIKEVEQNAPSLAASLCRAVYTILIPPEKTENIDNRIKAYLNPLVKKILFSNGKLLIDVSIGQKGNVRPIDLLKSLWPETDIDELKLWRVNREELYCERDNN